MRIRCCLQKNRLADNWRHLIAIADLAGGEWPLTRSAIAKLAPEAEEFPSVSLLAEIRRAFSASPLDKLTSAEVCEYLNNLEFDLETWTAQSLASKLKPFRIRPKAIRIGGKVLRGYELAQFADVFERYLDKDPNSTQDGSALRQTLGSPARPQQHH